MSICPFCEKSVPAGGRNCPHCGAAMNNDVVEPGDLGGGLEGGELQSLLEQGRKIEAIKLYREQTGAGLKEAKDAVEAMTSETTQANLREALARHSPDGEGLSLEEELLRLLRNGEKIEAIKCYRGRTGAGLREAKDAVEALAAQHGIAAKSAGCLAVLLLWLLSGLTATGAALLLGLF